MLWFDLSLCISSRSYGRAPKMIHLEANFVQFKEELLPKEGNKALLTFPFLHIYWTDCCVSLSLNQTVESFRSVLWTVTEHHMIIKVLIWSCGMFSQCLYKFCLGSLASCELPKNIFRRGSGKSKLPPEVIKSVNVRVCIGSYEGLAHIPKKLLREMYLNQLINNT